MRVVVVIVIVLAVVALVAIVAPRMRRQHDAVDSFRRQIDALSPEARRPVIDQVHNATTAKSADDAKDETDRDTNEDDARGA